MIDSSVQKFNNVEDFLLWLGQQKCCTIAIHSSVQKLLKNSKNIQQHAKIVKYTRTPLTVSAKNLWAIAHQILHENSYSSRPKLWFGLRRLLSQHSLCSPFIMLLRAWVASSQLSLMATAWVPAAARALSLGEESEPRYTSIHTWL